MDLAARLRAVEELLDVRICFHDLSGRIEPLVGAERIQHRHPYCAAMKARLSAACTACDAHFCQQQARLRPDGFWKTCYGGVLELYLPLRDGARLAGAAFVGGWRWTGTRLPSTVAHDPQAPVTMAKLSSLPALGDPERLDRLFAVGRMLARDLEGELRGGAAIGRDRASAIREFVASRLTADIGLADVAAHLGVSASRASILIRTLLGTTMPSLLRDARLAKARHLLALTELPVAEVARRCGLRDPRYFHRLFKGQEGCTPETWRQRGGA